MFKRSDIDKVNAAKFGILSGIGDRADSSSPASHPRGV